MPFKLRDAEVVEVAAVHALEVLIHAVELVVFLDTFVTMVNVCRMVAMSPRVAPMEVFGMDLNVYTHDKVHFSNYAFGLYVCHVQRPKNHHAVP